MSLVENLIKRLAPEGVGFRPIGEVAAKSSNIKWATAGDAEFRYIDLSSVDRVTRQIGETAAINAENAPSRAQQVVRTGDVIFATTRPAQMRWAVIPPEYDGQIASTGYCVLRPDTSIVLRNFLAHLLGSDKFRQYIEANQVEGNYPSIPDSRVRSFRIPVPPLEVQRGIVRILDQFTQLEAELEAELEARRQQYAFYRNQLLTFPESGGVPRIPMSDLGTFVRGRRFTKNDVVDAGIPSIHYGEIYTDYGVSATNAIREIRTEMGRQLRFAQPGDVIFAGVGETVEDVGKAVAWLGAVPVAVHDDTFSFTSELNPKYVAYLVQTEDFQKQKTNEVARGKVKRLSSAGLAKITIPVPDRAEQDRIVAVLDRFDALINDLNVGLPAELAARRQQYEYYRDKLLAFKEAV